MALTDPQIVANVREHLAADADGRWPYALTNARIDLHRLLGVIDRQQAGLAALRAELFNRVAHILPTGSDLAGPCMATFYDRVQTFESYEQARAWLEQQFAAEYGDDGQALLDGHAAALGAVAIAAAFMRDWFGSATARDGDPLHREAAFVRKLLTEVQHDPAAVGTNTAARLKAAEACAGLLFAMAHSGHEMPGSAFDRLDAWLATVPEGERPRDPRG